MAAASAPAQSIFPGSPQGQPVTQAVDVTIQSAGTLSTIQVLTMGVPGKDFTAAASGSTCAAATHYAAGDSCDVAVTFTPAYPGSRLGAVVLLDSSGVALATQFLSGTGKGAVGILVPGEMTTFAGDGQWVSVGDGQAATSAELNLPAGVALDGAGNLYIADSGHNRVREVIAATGVIETIAGNGGGGYSGDNGAAVQAALSSPRSVALDGAGNIFIADTGNNVIRKIAAGSGVITTVAGDGTQGYFGDNGLATAARLASPAGVTVDAAGKLYIADTANHRIRAVDPSTANIVTVAGNGVTGSTGAGSYSGDGGPATGAGLNFPYAVAFDAAGNMFIPDSGNNRVREVLASGGNISTFAGTGVQGFSGDNGAAGSARLNSPSGVAFDAAGNLFIADTQNNRIRKVIAGQISTIAGNGTGRYTGDANNAWAGGLFGPSAVIVDPLGDFFIADYFDHRVRKVSGEAGVQIYVASVRVGQVSAPQSQMVENDGNAPLAFSAFSAETNSAIDPASTTCSTAIPLAMDSNCELGIEFAPEVAGTNVTGSVSIVGAIVDPFVNSPLSVELIGNALSLNSTAVWLTSSANPANYGQSVTLSATVSTGTGTLTGNVTFTDGGSPIGAPIPVDGSGSASYTLVAPAVGLHSIVAAYGGDSGHPASTSVALLQVIGEATATTLTSSLNPSTAGASVVFTATVASQGGGIAPTGTVVFSDGAAALGSGALNAQGSVSLATSSLAAGSHSITAVYGGVASAYVLASASATLSQQVQVPTTTRISSATNPSVYGAPAVFTATVAAAGGTPVTGTANFFDQTTQIGSAFLSASGGVSTASFATSSLAAGIHSISAAYVASADALASVSPALTQTVELSPTSVSAAASPNPALADSPVVLSAKVAGAGATGNGSVVFLIDGASIGSQALDASGAASISTSALAVGQHVMTANYLGGADNSPGVSAPVSLTVQPIPTATSLTVPASSAPASAIGGSTSQITLTATVIGTTGPVPTGTVSFQSGSTILGVAVLNGSGTATLAVSLGLGTSDIVASYPGDLVHSPSTSAQVAVSIEIAGFQIQANPTSVSMASSQNAVVTIAVASSGAYADQIGLGCASLPAEVTCHFTNDSLALAANGQQTVQLTIDTNLPLTGGTVARETAPRSGSGPPGIAIAGCLAPAVFFWIFGLARRRGAPRKTLLAVLCAAAVAQLVGCGSISQKSAAPGTYVIQVVGTGSASGLTEAVPLTVVVTK